jgi:hypothetical protein
MTLPVADYAPWGNAQLTFTVTGDLVSADLETGNIVTGTEELQYLAALQISRPNWQKQEGVDMTTYTCTGRLLFPPALDPRITNGSQAVAVINGYAGRLELVFDLAMDEEAYGVIRQSINGTFRVIGGRAIPTPAL